MTKVQQDILKAAQSVRRADGVTDAEVAMVREAIRPDYKLKADWEAVDLNEAAAQVLGHFHAQTGPFKPKEKDDAPSSSGSGGSATP